MGWKRFVPEFLKKAFRRIFYTKKRKPRHQIIDLAMDFCRCNKIEGDYFEFGVWQGDTFKHAFQAAQERNLSNMRFFAFDSFQGFSEPGTNDDIGLIKQGSRACSEKDFTSNISKHKVDLDKVIIVPGWFSDTLNTPTKTRIFAGKSDGHKAAIIYIDCDLYEPVVCCLDFITDLITDGTVLIFDDWFYLKAHPQRGERRAFSEWRDRYPEIKVTEYANVGWHGKSFILNQ